MAYVYRHIRLDKNVPFYIGIGSQDNYSRAYTKANRNKHWHNIANKAGYLVEIIIDDLTWDKACEKEVEFIALYGRKEKGGILCNLTDGGGGAVGLITSDETKKKQSLKKIGKPPSNKGKPMLPHVMESLRAANVGRPSWNKGIPPSEEAKAKRKEKMRGRPSSFKGKTHTESSNEKNRIAHIGKRAWNKGLKTSSEVAEKIRQSKIGKPSWNKGKKMSEEWKIKNPNGMKKAPFSGATD